MSESKDAPPTIGLSHDVDEASRLWFESWPPIRWLKRKQIPDVHVDYRVEVVEAGEPTGLNFLAQIKGRRLDNRTRIRESFKTKHLRYYLKCEEPVFLFLLDPYRKEGYWLFVHDYLRRSVPEKLLSDQKTLAVRFDSNCSMGNFEAFRAELKRAWAYIRELHPGSPLAAILHEKQRLERLDPRYAVEIAASSRRNILSVRPRQVISDHNPITFRRELTPAELEAFHDKGDALRIKASDVQAEGSPILQDVLSRLGDTEIRLQAGHSFSGCIQLSIPTETEPLVIQLDGEWQLGARQVSFSGELRHSPLRARINVARTEGPTAEAIEIVFSFDWEAWVGQPILSLGYLNEILTFLATKEFRMRCYVRGFQPWTVATFCSGDPSVSNRASETLNLLRGCMRVAEYVGVNPPMPPMSFWRNQESGETHAMVELLNGGFHEQENSGQSTCLEGDAATEGEPAIGMRADLKVPDPQRTMNLLGMPIPFGPLTYKFTEMRLTEIEHLHGGRVRTTWVGEDGSRFRMEMERHSQ